MSKKIKIYFKTHWKFLTVTAVIFLFLSFSVIAPLQAMITLTNAQNLAIQTYNTALKNAINNNDYGTWSSLINDSSLTDKINAGNFSQFVAAYNYTMQGNIKAANTIRVQLGLKPSYEQMYSSSH